MSPQFTVYQLTKALVEQHGFVYDVAFLSVWYTFHDETPTASLPQIGARLQQVKKVPEVSYVAAKEMLSNYHRLSFPRPRKV